MKKILTLLIIFPLMILACEKNAPVNTDSYYTCPMHPQIRRDAPGQCPICGMDLVKVDNNPADHANHEALQTQSQESQKDALRINSQHVQNIGVITEKVLKRELSHEILAAGKVAHDEKLWIAQNEYLETLKLQDRTLIQASETRLKFMGLSDAWIQSLRAKKTADLGLHLPGTEAKTFFEISLYQGDAGKITEGLEVEITDSQNHYLTQAKIISVAELVDMESRSLRVLAEADQNLDLKPNTFVQARILTPIGEQLSVNKEAILFNGDHNMVYVMKDQGVFEPRTIKLGELAGDYYAVSDGLSENDVVVTNGHFLIDSEAQVKLRGAAQHQH